MHTFKPWLSGLLAALAVMPVAASDLTAPYALANRNPFVQVHGLPAAQSAELTAAGSTHLDLTLQVANSFTVGSGCGEEILIDGETHRADLRLARGIGERWELALAIPYISHEGGGLDGFIENWHDLFGLPDGGRPGYPRDQLRYSFRRDGRQQIDLHRSVDGIGDASVALAYQLADSPQRCWALRSQLKLPTGDADDLLGSDATDVAVGLHVSEYGLLRRYNIVLHGSVGWLGLGEGEVLDDSRKDQVWYGSGTFAWRYSPALSLKLQVDAHSAFYDSALTELGDDSAQLTLGGAVRWGRHWVVDFGVSEDIAVDTAPDVLFLVGIRAADF